jgi:hypothetical protein
MAKRPVQMHERKTPYLFFRKDMFYSLEMKNDDDARVNAECNPGTLRVEDISGRVVWRQQ